MPKWPPPDDPYSLGVLAVGSKLSSCSFWLPPVFYPPGKTKQPRVTFAGAMTPLQPCSVPGSHTAGFVPLGRSTETHPDLLPPAAAPDAKRGGARHAGCSRWHTLPFAAKPQEQKRDPLQQAEVKWGAERQAHLGSAWTESFGNTRAPWLRSKTPSLLDSLHFLLGRQPGRSARGAQPAATDSCKEQSSDARSPARQTTASNFLCHSGSAGGEGASLKALFYKTRQRPCTRGIPQPAWCRISSSILRAHHINMERGTLCVTRGR